MKVVKILHFGFVFVMLWSALLHAAPNTFVKALADYSTGNEKEAYPAFEQVFEDQKSTPEQRLKSALVLAFAPNSLLKQKKHRYAGYYLEHAQDIPAATQVPLLRTAGDGYFDELKLDLAARYYSLLAKSLQLKNQAYAEYRLGWLELNRQKPTLTTRRWIRFLSMHGQALLAEDEDLFRSILRDLGKAWVETSDENLDPASEYVQLLQKQWTHKHHGVFVDGIVSGLKRLSQPSKMTQFRNQLLHTSIVGAVFEQLLSRGILFDRFPCEINSWAENSPFALRGLVLNYVNACAKTISEKSACTTPSGLAVQKFFETFDLKGEELLPRISLSMECEKYSSSCRDLLKYGHYRAEDKSSLLEAKAMKALSLACAGLKGPEAGAVQSDLSQLIQIYVQKSLYPQEPSHPIHALTSLALDRGMSVDILRSQFKALDAEIRYQIFLLWLKSEKYPDIWAEWNHFATLQLEPALLKYFYEGTVLGLQKKTLDPQAVSSKTGEILKRISSEDMTLGLGEVHTVLGKVLPASPFLKDLESLAQLSSMSKKLQSIHLSSGRSMLRVLSTQLKSMVREEAFISKTPWSGGNSAEKAKFILHSDYQFMVKELENLKAKLSAKAETQEWIAQVKQIQLQIQAKISGGGSSEN